MSFLLEGRVEYEFRTTVVAEFHNDESFRGIGEWIQGAEQYWLQRFVDRDSVPFEGLHSPAEEDLKRWAEALKPYVKRVEVR